MKYLLLSFVLSACAMPPPEAKVEASKWMSTMGISGKMNCYNYDKFHNTVCDIVDTRGFSYKLTCSYEVGCVLND